MILIADSGSTKADWRLIDEHQQIHQYATQGINPYFQNEETISMIIQNELLPQLKSGVQSVKPEIYFYGAGCGTVLKKKSCRSGIGSPFPDFSN
jgi:glucosamine kinase